MFSSSLRRRCFSLLRSAHPPVRKSVPVTCGSGGAVEVDLYNVDEFSPTKVLFLHLPSLPDSAHGVRQLPEFLHDWPVASINYRWAIEPPRAASQDGEYVDDDEYSVDWPVPIHDVAFAYQWIVEALKPPSSGRGDIYVYGSHLGAGLAMSLSLTNAHPHKRFAVRGVAAYNGVYNWTMFLPGHKVRGAKSARAAWRALQRNNGNLRLDALGDRLVALFQEPHNLFDPFASPSLFFHNPGLAIPESFYASAAYASLVNRQHDTSDETLEASRRSHLVFPPRASTLKIPETLLLHDAPSRSPLHHHARDHGDHHHLLGAQTKSKTTTTTTTTTKSRSKVVDTRHTFMAQAAEMASFMRRSIEMVELKERAKWDEDAQRLAREPERRVQVVEVGQEGEELGLNDAGQQAVLDWLGSLNIR